MRNNTSFTSPVEIHLAKDNRPSRMSEPTAEAFARELIRWAEYKAGNHYVSDEVKGILKELCYKAMAHLHRHDVEGCILLCDWIAEQADTIRLRVSEEWKQRAIALLPRVARLSQMQKIGLYKVVRFFGHEVPVTEVPRSCLKAYHIAQEGDVVFRYVQKTLPDIESYVGGVYTTLESAQPEETEEVDDREPQLFQSSDELAEELYDGIPIKGRVRRAQITRMRNDATKVAAKNLREARKFKLAHAG